jgi:uncharacterized protein YifN (PemK superfamily)
MRINHISLLVFFLFFQSQNYCQCDSIKNQFQNKIVETYSYNTLKKIIPSQWNKDLKGDIISSIYTDSSINIKLEISFTAIAHMLFSDPKRAIYFGNISITRQNNIIKFGIVETNDFGKILLRSRMIGVVSEMINSISIVSLNNHQDYQSLLEKVFNCAK